MEALINHILQFGDLNKQQIEFLLSKVQTLEFKKDDYLSEATTRYLSFIESFPNLINRIPLSYVALFAAIYHTSISIERWRAAVKIPF